MKHSSQCAVLLAITLTVIATVPRCAQAYWRTNGILVGTGAYPTTWPKYGLMGTPDGCGGAIVSWADSLQGEGDIFAQRIDGFGTVVWTSGGVSICSAANRQCDPRVVSDGAGGAIIAWYDHRSGTSLDIYAQRVDASGNLLWTSDGVPICAEAGDQQYPQIIERNGGCIIVWEDFRGGSEPKLYAQCVDTTGTALWAVNGIPIPATTLQGNFNIASDGAGGALVVWGYYTLYAQRVDGSGAMLWEENGVAFSGPLAQYWPRVTTDMAGGAIVTWYGYHYDIYAERIDSSGTLMWGPDGIPVCADPSSQESPTIASDGAGGAIITWGDTRRSYPPYYDVYAQRVDGSGTALWTPNGIPVSEASGVGMDAEIISDGAGGAIIGWAYSRNDSGYDIYAQRVDQSGQVLWATNGVALCTAGSDQSWPGLTSDGGGGAIVGWFDYRDGNPPNVYAQRVDGTGYCGFHMAPVISAVKDVPNDQGGKITLQWERSSVDTLPSSEISHYSVWRRLSDVGRALLVGPSERSLQRGMTIEIDGRKSSYRLAPEGFAWEWLADVSAHHFATYALTVQSLYDSMGVEPGFQYFMVTAHTNDPVIYYDSPVDSGYSVDNLSPAVPGGLMWAAAWELEWLEAEEEDFDYFTVYGSDVPDLDETATVIGYTVGPSMHVGSGYLYYHVTAMDFSGNEGAAATMPSPTGIPGQEGLYYSLEQGQPNPFRVGTVIRFTLAAPGDVTMYVYDTQGRKIETLVDSWLPAGAHEIAWGTGAGLEHDVNPGVYFVQMEVGDFRAARKLVVIR